MRFRSEPASAAVPHLLLECVTGSSAGHWADASETATSLPGLTHLGA